MATDQTANHQETCNHSVSGTCLDGYIQQVLSYRQPDGGFKFSPHSGSRPDATAWAIFVLDLHGYSQHSLEDSRNQLAMYQHEDGRVSIDAQHPEAFWPTPLAMLAWRHSETHAEHFSKASEFLLNSSGKHWENQPDSPLKHDTSIKGWSWIEETHSWVESTSIAMMALHYAGQTHHPRVQEAASLLLNRQLPQGGWNYGNTEVFGQELRPSPEDTGAALSALAGRVAESRVANSLGYLREEVKTLRTPLALGWSILGLNAWGKAPHDAVERIVNTFNREKRFGGYDTPSLCLLLAAANAPQGLSKLV